MRTYYVTVNDAETDDTIVAQKIFNVLSGTNVNPVKVEMWGGKSITEARIVGEWDDAAPFVVETTSGDAGDEVLGSYDTFEEAVEAAQEYEAVNSGSFGNIIVTQDGFRMWSGFTGLTPIGQTHATSK